MIQFSVHFIYCNILISVMIAAITLAKKILRKHLSAGSQYHIWFLLPVVLALPFLSVRPAGFSWLIRWFHFVQANLSPKPDTAMLPTAASPLSTADWLNDFAISVTRNSAPAADFVPLVIWAVGMGAMTVFMIRSRLHLYCIEKSALPLQSADVRRLYQRCRTQLRIRRDIPIYSTAFIRSPIVVGMFRPRIYIPIRLITDFAENDIRYMLLHELQHYKHKDALINFLMNIASMLYWFNPAVWYAVREIRTDREIACDSFVLQMLDQDDYIAYGNTLLNFAQKMSLYPFSLAAGIGGSAGQIRKRILNIAAYRPQTKWQTIRERTALAFLAALILESTALIPVLASEPRAALPEGAVIQTEDLSEFFADREGCFVLYDTSADIWILYNETHAAKRFSPDSTYKIYSALFALENQLIRPDSSILMYDGQSFPYPEWNQDQDLDSAMRNSVNWYFQELDQRADWNALKEFYRAIEYGNSDLSSGVHDFWMESSLKISALEQVELMRKLYTNEFDFDSRNVQAVKDSLKLSEQEGTVLFGKTGTGIVNDKSVNGWFVGYVESDDNTCFFATNIQGTDHTDSLTAAEITRNILEAKQIEYPSAILDKDFTW